MATGYNIILPNGSTQIVKASSYEQRVQICNELLSRWSGYCQSNWLSVNYNNPFSPENKIKMFLSSLGYFLIGSGGGTNGILSRYKDVMNGKREIPVSSCPAYIEDCVYGTVHTGGSESQFSKNQEASFNEYMQFLDEKAQRSYKKRPPKIKPKIQMRSDRMYRVLGDGAMIIKTLPVDTDGVFCSEGVSYRIDMEHCKQYAPTIISEQESLYDMDSIICVVMTDGSTRFFDQDFYPFEDGYIIQCG